MERAAAMVSTREARVPIAIPAERSAGEQQAPPDAPPRAPHSARAHVVAQVGCVCYAFGPRHPPSYAFAVLSGTSALFGLAAASSCRRELLLAVRAPPLTTCGDGRVLTRCAATAAFGRVGGDARHRRGLVTLALAAAAIDRSAAERRVADQRLSRHHVRTARIAGVCRPAARDRRTHVTRGTARCLSPHCARMMAAWPFCGRRPRSTAPAPSSVSRVRGAAGPTPTPSRRDRSSSTTIATWTAIGCAVTREGEMLISRSRRRRGWRPNSRAGRRMTGGRSGRRCSDGRPNEATPRVRRGSISWPDGQTERAKRTQRRGAIKCGT